MLAFFCCLWNRGTSNLVHISAIASSLLATDDKPLLGIKGKGIVTPFKFREPRHTFETGEDNSVQTWYTD